MLGVLSWAASAAGGGGAICRWSIRLVNAQVHADSKTIGLPNKSN